MPYKKPNYKNLLKQKSTNKVQVEAKKTVLNNDNNNRLIDLIF